MLAAWPRGPILTTLIAQSLPAGALAAAAAAAREGGRVASEADTLRRFPPPSLKRPLSVAAFAALEALAPWAAMSLRCVHVRTLILHRRCRLGCSGGGGGGSSPVWQSPRGAASAPREGRGPATPDGDGGARGTRRETGRRLRRGEVADQPRPTVTAGREGPDGRRGVGVINQSLLQKNKEQKKKPQQPTQPLTARFPNVHSPCLRATPVRLPPPPPLLPRSKEDPKRVGTQTAVPADRSGWSINRRPPRRGHRDVPL